MDVNDPEDHGAGGNDNDRKDCHRRTTTNAAWCNSERAFGYLRQVLRFGVDAGASEPRPGRRLGHESSTDWICATRKLESDVVVIGGNEPVMVPSLAPV